MSIYIPSSGFATQGPAPDGFHVPLQSEWQAIYDAYTGLGLSGGTNFSTYLKMPMEGYRYYDTTLLNVGSYGYYLSSSPDEDNVYNALFIAFNTSSVFLQEHGARAYGFSVRCFKDYPTTPTASWTKLYGTSIESGGIFHNPTDGLISISSDGTTWYTLMDKNLGATTVYNYGDTLTDANCGNVFQRGNNYAFPGTKSSASITTSSSQVNASTYGPGNYYSSSTWIEDRKWDSSDNNNLRGGTDGNVPVTTMKEAKNIYLGEGKTTVLSDMQGPCPDGYHIPTKSEASGLCTIINSLGLSGKENMTCLFMPPSGYRLYSSGQISQTVSTYLWTCTRYSRNYPYRFGLYNGGAVVSNNLEKTYGFSIRPFKNKYVNPDSTWTVIKGTLGSAGIFYNETDGIISVTGDGTTGYTIADKNLGATQVYHSGDTSSEANCGKYYQRGNNYGFDGIGGSNPTTINIQVDASTYGPGNYYSFNKFITVNPWDSSDNANIWGGVSQGSSTIVNPGIKEVYIGTTKVYPAEKPDYLCFTANTAGSTIKLNKEGSPRAVTLETSTDGESWSTYTFGSTITLSNVGDKVYWRNTSETDTGFSVYNGSLYKFVMTGSISGSGDVNFLLNKNSTTTLSAYCFTRLFLNCSALTTPPKLPATAFAGNCYQYMFSGCDNLTTLPKIYATSTATDCCGYMFDSCSKIKISTTQTGDYQTPYRIPTTGTGTGSSSDFYNMFYKTGGTFTGTPSLNTTYYTSNTVV